MTFLIYLFLSLLSNLVISLFALKNKKNVKNKLILKEQTEIQMMKFIKIEIKQQVNGNVIALAKDANINNLIKG